MRENDHIRVVRRAIEYHSTRWFNYHVTVVIPFAGFGPERCLGIGQGYFGAACYPPRQP